MACSPASRNFQICVHINSSISFRKYFCVGACARTRSYFAWAWILPRIMQHVVRNVNQLYENTYKHEYVRANAIDAFLREFVRRSKRMRIRYNVAESSPLSPYCCHCQIRLRKCRFHMNSMKNNDGVSNGENRERKGISRIHTAFMPIQRNDGKVLEQRQNTQKDEKNCNERNNGN